MGSETLFINGGNKISGMRDVGMAPNSDQL